MPDDYKGMLEMKGVGEYTAAAVASIAYNQPVALVDGNVYRVLARYYGIKTAIDLPAAKKEFLEKATTILNHKRPGDHNQALMELGALVCTPSDPRCTDCPLRKGCYALKHKQTSALPVKNRKKEVSVRYFNYLVIRKGDVYKRQECITPELRPVW